MKKLLLALLSAIIFTSSPSFTDDVENNLSKEAIAVARAEQERSAMRIAPRPNECRYVYGPVLVPELNANGRVVYRQRQGVTLVCAKCVKAGNGWMCAWGEPGEKEDK